MPEHEPDAPQTERTETDSAEPDSAEPEGTEPPISEPPITERQIYRPPQAEPPVEAKGPRAWPLGLLFGLLNFPVGGLLAAALGNFSDLVGCVLPTLVLVGEVIAGIYLRRQGQERLGKALLFAPAFTAAIAVVVGVVVFGICLILLKDSGF